MDSPLLFYTWRYKYDCFIKFCNTDITAGRVYRI